MPVVYTVHVDLRHFRELAHKYGVPISETCRQALFEALLKKGMKPADVETMRLEAAAYRLKRYEAVRERVLSRMSEGDRQLIAARSEEPWNLEDMNVRKMGVSDEA